MIISKLRERKQRKKIKELLNSIKSILKSNSSEFSEDLLKKANHEIFKAEEILKSTSEGDLSKSVNSLENFLGDDLKGYGKSKLRQNVESIAVALLLALVIRTFVIQPFKIPSGSMIPTLLVGDHLLVNKFIFGTNIPLTNTYLFPVRDIKRGDIVVFKFPINSEEPEKKSVHYIKRVVAVGGDTIKIKGRDVYINGTVVDQKYLGDYRYWESQVQIVHDEYQQILDDNEFKVIYGKGLNATTKGKLRYPITVPENHVFVMGDNRDNSFDSRFWGFVPRENIAGKAFLIHWSWDFKNSEFLHKVRWYRIFSSIN